MRVVGAAGTGIMLEDADGEPRFAAASDDRIVEIELVQERIRSTAASCRSSCQRRSPRLRTGGYVRWGVQESNLRPLACRASALAN
jgi:hypothetical protein